MPTAAATPLTPARALIADMVRRYSILDCGCTIVEAQKLCWFLQRAAHQLDIDDPLNLEFSVDKYGPFSTGLQVYWEGLENFYLRCEKRLAEAGPYDAIWFDRDSHDQVSSYLHQPEHGNDLAVLDRAEELIDGYQTPFGLELLATVDWLIRRESAAPNPAAIRHAFAHWPPDRTAGERKLRLFDDRVIGLALQRLTA